MAKLEYIARKPLSYQQLLRLIERARKIPQMKEFTDLEFESAETTFAKLPEPDSFGELKLRSINVEGSMRVHDSSFPQLRSIFEDGAKHLGKPGLFTVGFTFQERTGKQNKTYCDSIRLFARHGKLTFYYNTSKGSGATDDAYRKNVFADMIREGNLPMRLVETASGYDLEHLDGGEPPCKYRNVYGQPKGNPTDIRCDINTGTPGELFDKAVLLLNRHASPKRFDYEWSADGDDDQLQGCTPKKFYKIVCARNYPATRYLIRLIYDIKGLAAVEGLRRFLGDECQMSVGLFSVPVPGRARAYIEAEATADGYLLTLQLHDPDHVKLVEKQLAMRFPDEPPV